MLLYIHGGGFATGSGSLAIGADDFVREQNIVLVSVNHRLNIFGYLYLGDFDDKYAQSGIAGILDLVLALEWVRSNIEAFGGDPANVTIIGESGGAMKVNMLLSLDCAKGLFNKAIVESGSSPAFTVTKEQGAAIAKIALGRLGISPDDLSPIADLTTEQIKEALSDVLSGLMGFSPVADGIVAKYNADGKYHIASGADVPVMVGASEDEVAVFVAPGKKDGEFVVNDSSLRQYLLDNASRIFEPLPGYRLDSKSVDDIIAAGRADNPKEDDADHIAMKIVSACSMLCSGAYFQAAEKAALNTQPVYHYLVKYDVPHPLIPGARYAWHTADLPLQLSAPERYA